MGWRERRRARKAAKAAATPVASVRCCVCRAQVREGAPDSHRLRAECKPPIHACHLCVASIVTAYRLEDWKVLPALQNREPSAERGAEQPAAATQQPSPPPPPAVEEEPLEEGWGFALSKFAALEQRLDARLAALERETQPAKRNPTAKQRKAFADSILAQLKNGPLAQADVTRKLASQGVGGLEAVKVLSLLKKEEGVQATKDERGRVTLAWTKTAQPV